MNPELPLNPREELEVRVTSLLLGELSEAEAASVRAALANDPELQQLHDDLKRTIHLVREATVGAGESSPEQSEPLKLSEERRKSLGVAFLIPPLKPEHVQPKPRFEFRLIELLVVIAVIALLSAMLLPSLGKAKSKAQSVQVRSNLRQLEVAKQLWAEENKKTAGEAPTIDDLKPYLGGRELPSVSGEKYVVGKLGEPVVAELSAKQAKGGFGKLPALSPAADPETLTVTVTADGRASYAGANRALVQTAAGSKSWNAAGSLHGFYDDQYATAVPAKKGVTLGEQSLETLPAEPKLASPPTEIVLPKSGADEPVLIAGSGGDKAENLFFASGARGGGGGAAPALQYQWLTGDAQKSAGLDAESGKAVSLGARNMFGLKEQAEPASLVPPAAPSFHGSPANPPGQATTTFSLGEDAQNQVAASGVAVATDRAVADNFAARQRALSATTISGYVDTSPQWQMNTSATVSEGEQKAFGYNLNVVKESIQNQSGEAMDAAISEAVQKPVPVLGDLPTIGRLYRTVDSDSANTQLPAKPASSPVNKSGSGDLALNGQNGFVGGTVVNSGKLSTVEQPSRDKLANQNAKAQEVAGSLDFSSVQIFNGRLIEDEARLEAEKKKLGTLTGLPREQQLKVLPNVEPDVQFNELSSQLNIAEKALIKTAKVLGPESSDYKTAKALVDDLTKKVNNRLDGTIAGLQTRVDSLEANTATLRAKLASARSNDIARAVEAKPYYDKKREFENLVAFQKILEQRLAMEKADVTLPHTGPVTIMNRAVPPAAADTGVFGRIGQALKGDYQAAASVKLDRPATDVSEFSSRSAAGVYDPYFIQTEFEGIKSETVLTNVIVRLDLNKKWAAKTGSDQPLKTSDTLDLLRSHLDLKPVRNTMMVEIQGKSSDPKEAAEIANAVAEAYRDHRQTEIRRQSEGGVKALEARYVEQQAKVKQAAQELAALREGGKAVATTNVIDAPLPRKPATNAPVPQPEIQTSENNFSTFSLNVSDVSFKLAAASLEQGQLPDSASIRSEEFINSFDYRDPDAAAGAPIAFAWERVRYPFAHNRDLLRFSLKTAAAGRQAGRPLNIVLLLDNSGSMERADRVAIIREALRVLAKQLQPQDKLSVITFARTPRLVADGVAGDQAGEVTERISGLTPEGGTNLEDAMNLAYKTAAKHYLANGINRVVVLTDGAANLGDVDPESLKQKVEAQRKQGIALDCFGVGWEGFNDDLLEVLSRNGDGRYGFINSPEEAATEFAGQLAGALKVAASDVKVQVEFNPKRVTSYRQIGYAKHQLTKEQFRDNTVDAAEIAAQEAGNALYTVDLNPAGEGPLGTVHVRYKIPGTTDYREQAWDVPFTGGAAALEQASPAMRLATSASAFSEWLAVSPFAGEVTPDALLNCLSGVPEAFGADSRPKKLEWMIRQAKSLEGK